MVHWNFLDENLMRYDLPYDLLTSASLPPPPESRYTALESRVIAGYISAASALVLIIQGSLCRRRLDKGQWSPTASGSYIASHGSWTILAFQVIRLLSNAAFFALATFTSVRGDWSELGNNVVVVASAYALCLAVLLLLVPVAISHVISFHATLATLSVLGAYLYRDFWPLLTFTLTSADECEGRLIWVKVALAGVASVVVPVLEPHVYVPHDPMHPQAEPSLEQTTSYLGFFTFSFISPLIAQSRRVPHLAFDMLPPILDIDQMRVLGPRSARYLDPLMAVPRRVNLYRGLFFMFAGTWARQTVLVTLGALAVLSSPVGTNRLLGYIERGGAGAIVRPWVWVAVIALAPLAQNAAEQLYIYYNKRAIAQIDAALTGVVSRHALRIRVLNEADEGSVAPTIHSRTQVRSENADGLAGKTGQSTEQQAKKAKNIVGDLSVLVTADLANITAGSDWIRSLLSTTLQAVLGSWFLYSIMGWSALVGVGVMVALIPIPAWVSSFMSRVQKQKMQATDRRVKYITEILTVLRMVKEFGWERQVKAQIDTRREEELRWVFRRGVLQAVNTSANFIIPIVHLVVTFLLYTTIQRQRLTASIVFSALTGFNMLRSAMDTFIEQVPSLIQANVSIGRMQVFLNSAELLDRYSTSDTTAAGRHAEELGFAHASFFWSKEHVTDARTTSHSRFSLRVEDDIVFKPGVLNLVLGPTGCGKTSLLMALLGEMHYVPSGDEAWVNLPRQGGVAYCAQEAWIQSMSIKDNILFGAPYEEARYQKVLHQCNLERDLSLFDAGDLTDVGEKGLTLSGGQKARIALARAVYSSAAVLLLDDILAALDVSTSVWIVRKCLNGDLVHGRTVILVTHSVTLTLPIADYVVSFDADGHITGKDVSLTAHELSIKGAHEEEVVELEEELEREIEEPKTVSSTGAKLVVSEEVHQGHVSWKAIKLLVLNCSSWPATFYCGYLLGCVFNETLEVFQLWWLGHWANQYSGRVSVNITYYLGCYAAITLLIVLTYVSLSIMSTFASINVGRAVHNRLTSSLLAATFRWLDTVPTSRVISRCTQDIQSIDGPLVRLSNQFISMAVAALSRLLAIMISAPVFVIPAALVAGIGAVLSQVYIKAQLSVKRERSNAKAPVIAAINGAFAGLVSIRAFDAQAAFIQQSEGKIDRYTRVSMVFYHVNRWIAVRIQLLSSAFAGGLAFYLVYGPGRDTRTASTIGFTLNMAVFFSRQTMAMVRVFNMLETEANSLERVQSYLEIEKEPEPRESGVPPAYWPASGALRAEGLTARYSSDGPVVLDHLSFDIKAGERIGIVGRTGSGKSTLTLALLRCIFTEGEVYYDGLPTSALNLDALRKNVTIIPQAPELLSGTLRMNLDLFGQHEDAELNDALRAAGLFALQAGADESRLALDSQIAAGGGNLSVGQRQIIAMARAIVRQSKLLILDEATSAIDHETDAAIQASLRTALKSDVTVLCVAHRLQSVVDADRIMVLDAGKLVELDSPKRLLGQEGSFFRALVNESADKEILYSMINPAS